MSKKLVVADDKSMLETLINSYNELLLMGVPVDIDETFETHVNHNGYLVTFGRWESSEIYLTIEKDGEMIRDWDCVFDTKKALLETLKIIK